MLWNLSEPSCDYYWLLYGIDLLQHKNTSCYSMSWEGLPNILKLKFNPSFHKKKERETRTPGTKLRRQAHLKHLQSPTELLQPSFKRAYFWNFIIPVIPCFYISHCIRFCWHQSCGNSEICDGLEPTMFNFYPPWATLWGSRGSCDI